MKKLLFGFIATIMCATIGTAQNTITLQSSVTEKDYNELSENEQKIVDYIDASVAALKAIALNKSKLKPQAAIISVSSKTGPLENNVVISEQEPDISSAQSCTICGVGSGLICFRKIRTQLENGPVVITAVLVKDCVVISW